MLLPPSLGETPANRPVSSAVQSSLDLAKCPVAASYETAVGRLTKISRRCLVEDAKPPSAWEEAASPPVGRQSQNGLRMVLRRVVDYGKMPKKKKVGAGLAERSLSGQLYAPLV